MLFFLMLPPPPTSTLFPYTTLFRSRKAALAAFERIDIIRRAEPGRAEERDEVLEAALAQFRRFVTRHVGPDRKSTRLNSSHEWISYAVFCLKKKKKRRKTYTISHTL